MDEAGERFLPVQLEGIWWPTTTELPRFTIATQLLPPTFQQAMGRAKSDAVLHLGYPLEVFAASDDGLMVRAIASVPLRWKAIGDGLVELSPIDTSLSVNPNWISYHLKNFDFFALLRRLGADNSDEDTEALTTELGELPDLCAALNLAFAQKRLDDLDPTKTASTLLRDFGIQNAAALFVVADARFSAGAIRDLTELSKREIAEFKGTALGTVLGLEIPRMTNNPSVVEPLDLTFSQLTAVRSGLSQALSVITGPPGTGKSQVVATILASAALAGKTVLFASRNHAALDAVEERLRELSPERPLLLRLNQRWGQGQPVRLHTLISQLVSRPGGLSDRQPLELRVATLGGLDRERSKLTDRAIEVAQKRELVGALEDELERHLTLLAFDLSRALNLPTPRGMALSDAGKLRKVSKCLRRLIAKITRQGSLIRDEWRQAGCPDPALDAEAFDRWTEALKGAQAVSSSIRAAADTLPAESEQVSMGRRIEEISKRIRSSSPSLLLDLARLLDTCHDQQRSRLIELRGQSDKRRLSAETIRLLLPHYPLWACSNLTISRFVGLDLGLFDYVVIDEASQCDIASAIPLLARAKQAVIVGDPAQLSMISRLSPDWEAETLSNLKLSDAPGIGRFMQSRNSLFDLASTVSAINPTADCRNGFGI